jgi:hypothetical protein
MEISHLSKNTGTVCTCLILRKLYSMCDYNISFIFSVLKHKLRRYFTHMQMAMLKQDFLFGL